jgi:Ras GTPase-activating-like protein IQGAP2/3
VNKTVDVAARKNLSQISRVLAQITSGVGFGEDNPSYIPINDYVTNTNERMSMWMLEGHFNLVTLSCQLKNHSC